MTQNEVGTSRPRSSRWMDFPNWMHPMRIKRSRRTPLAERGPAALPERSSVLVSDLPEPMGSRAE